MTEAAEREAELIALQTAFDEYIASSRELEEELDEELANMQERLSESSAANAVLSAQLENISPQLTSLETSLSNCRQKLKEEQKLRRAAEQSSDENDQKFRELEQTVNSLKEEIDELHEELAFKENELEETRLELEVEKQELVNQITDLKSNNPVELSEDAEYTKKLEEELEVVTEQLIDTEKKLADAEVALQRKMEQLEKTAQNNLHNDETEQKNTDLELKVTEQESENKKLQHQISELAEELNLAKEEIALTTDELHSLETDLKQATETLEDERAQHQNELKGLNEAFKESRIQATASRKEVEVISTSLQDYNKENEQLTVQNAALERALDDMKADYEKLAEELDLVNERFDTVKQEAEQAGREAAFEEARENMKVDNEFEITKIQENLFILQKENKALQDKIDALNSSNATESEAVAELRASLKNAKTQLAKKESEMGTLTKELESRLTGAERKVTELEAELHTAKGQLAEADAHLIVLKAKAEQAEIPKSPRQEHPKTPATRARSASPSSVMKLELRLCEERQLREDLEKKFSELEDQKRMAEVRIKHLEGELKKHGHGTIVVQNTDTKLFDEDENVDDLIESRDVKKMAEELKALNEKCVSQRNYNAQLLSKMLHLQGNIQVYARVRPMSDREISSGKRCVVEALSENELGTFDTRINKWKSFNFDKVWGPDQSQNSIFQDVEPLALSVVDGFNACIFAYGQTGSGKTYTMEGIQGGNQYGISYRTIQKIFHLLKMRQQDQKRNAVYVGDEEPQEEVTFSFELQVGMLEIYNDEVYDLLGSAGASMAEKKENAIQAGGKASLEIRRNQDGRVDVPNLTKEKVNSIDEVMELLRRGNSNRATASTDLNEHSSRSHMVLSVDVVSGVGETSSNKGTLYLVDLAGSERVRKSNVEGDNLKEAGFINKSLSALGNVMEALDRKASHVPYRDSKLTYLLQNSLGGNSRTMMIVTICPMDSAHDESVHALQFATRVRRIQIGSAKRNVTSKNLEETVKKLTEEMLAMTRAKERSEGQLLTLKRDNTRVQEKLNNLSKSRLQSKNDSKTLEVLRKNNDEMAARWQQEKTMREEAAEELDKSKTELRMTQHQLSRFKSKLTQLEQTLEDKERALERATDEMQLQRNRKTAATVRSRRTEVLSSRVRTPAVSASNIQSPSPSRTGSTHTSRSAASTPATNGEAQVSAEDVVEIRSKVLALLEKHDKAKVDRIDIIMEKFQGKEALLLEKMTQRYESRLLNPTSSVASRNELALQRHQERMQRIHDKRSKQNGVQ